MILLFTTYFLTKPPIAGQCNKGTEDRKNSRFRLVYLNLSK